jgi:polyhydroxyalkanoate synthesis regulator phasin
MTKKKPDSYIEQLKKRGDMFMGEGKKVTEELAKKIVEVRDKLKKILKNKDNKDENNHFTEKSRIWYQNLKKLKDS